MHRPTAFEGSQGRMAPPDQVIGRGLTEAIGFRRSLDDRLLTGTAIKGAISASGARREATGTAGREAIAGAAFPGALEWATLFITAGAEGGTSRRPGAGAAGETVGGGAIAGRAISTAALPEGTIAEGAACSAAIGERTGRAATIRGAAIAEGGAIPERRTIPEGGAITRTAGCERTIPRRTRPRRTGAEGAIPRGPAPGGTGAKGSITEGTVAGGAIGTGPGTEGALATGTAAIGEGATLRAGAAFSGRSLVATTAKIGPISTGSGSTETGRLSRSATCATPGSLLRTTFKTGAHAQAGNGSGINRADLGLYQLI